MPAARTAMSRRSCPPSRAESGLIRRCSTRIPFTINGDRSAGLQVEVPGHGQIQHITARGRVGGVRQKAAGGDAHRAERQLPRAVLLERRIAQNRQGSVGRDGGGDFERRRKSPGRVAQGQACEAYRGRAGRDQDRDVLVDEHVIGRGRDARKGPVRGREPAGVSGTGPGDGFRGCGNEREDRQRQKQRRASADAMQEQ